MKVIVLLGPQAVGKMTIGEEIQRRTGLRLLHNHMTIELVTRFFSFGSPEGKRLVNLFRRELIEAIAQSDLPGMVLTFVMDFSDPNEYAHLKAMLQPFTERGAEIDYVELAADTQERLRRNRTPHRLEEKPTKRNVEWSDSELVSSMERYRLNSQPCDPLWENYLFIDNTALSPDEVAEQIISHFSI